MLRSCKLFLAVVACLSNFGISGLLIAHAQERPLKSSGWEYLPAFVMKGGLKAFWNVHDMLPINTSEAYAHGFLPITLVDPFSDRGGGSRERVDTYVSDHRASPWERPSFFEKVVRRDLSRITNKVSTLVLDIEIDFERSAIEARQKLDQMKLGALPNKDFEEAYFSEWAKWYSLPLEWAKEIFPHSMIGLYGQQLFNRDFWGIAHKTRESIESKHKIELMLWRHIDPFVDFYIADIYVFYPNPDSIYYIAANVELNYERSKRKSGKPIYAYEWLRYHNSNASMQNRELDDYLIEAMAVLPFFSGAKAVVLWGYEPLSATDGRRMLYKGLPLYLESLGRIASLSEKIGGGRLVFDEAADVLWRERKPLVRRIMISNKECVILVLDPWQAPDQHKDLPVKCGETSYSLEVNGQHATIAHIEDGQVKLH